ncbi:hypothetical protein Tco_0835900, partial [Tanacetum coccineum]
RVEVIRILAGQIVRFAAMAASPFSLAADSWLRIHTTVTTPFLFNLIPAVAHLGVLPGRGSKVVRTSIAQVFYENQCALREMEIQCGKYLRMAIDSYNCIHLSSDASFSLLPPFMVALLISISFGDASSGICKRVQLQISSTIRCRRLLRCHCRRCVALLINVRRFEAVFISRNTVIPIDLIGLCWQHPLFRCPGFWNDHEDVTTPFLFNFIPAVAHLGVLPGRGSKVVRTSIAQVLTIIP